MKNYNIYILLIVTIILHHSRSFVATGMTAFHLGLLGILAFIFCTKIYKIKNSLILSATILFLVMCLGSLFAHRLKASSIIATCCSLLPVLTFFLLKEGEIIRVRNAINNVFFVIILISFTLYIISFLGLSIFDLGVVKYNQYTFHNYLFFYLDVLEYKGSFTGFTIEPGFFSLLLVCLLLINEFDFHTKYVRLYFLCLLLSLSLGGYLLCFVGYMLHRSINGGGLKSVLKLFVITIVVLGMIISFALLYKGGNNILAEEIVYRLAFDDELGIVGNNRESFWAKELLDSYFYSKDIWFGIGYDNYYSAIENIEYYDACSWRIFVVVYGAIYTILFFFFLLIVWLKTDLKKTLPFFVVYWLDFYQHGELFSGSMYFLLLYMNINMKNSLRYSLYSATSKKLLLKSKEI